MMFAEFFFFHRSYPLILFVVVAIHISFGMNAIRSFIVRVVEKEWEQ